MPKGVYQRTAVNRPRPRTYPADIVAAVRDMYLNQGMTVVEVQAALPVGFKAQRIIERHIPSRRPAIKRDQRGERNTAWRGDAVSYKGVHLRLVAVRGKASNYPCNDCGATAREWSYDGECPSERTDPTRGLRFSTDLNSYSPRCHKCHRAYDKAMRERIAEGGDAK